LKKQREEKVNIDGTLYKVLVEETATAKETPYEVIRRLVKNNKERICCFDTNGGKKIC